MGVPAGQWSQGNRITEQWGVLQASARGVPCAEVNLEPSEATSLVDFAFQGRAGEILPSLFGVSVT